VDFLINNILIYALEIYTNKRENLDYILWLKIAHIFGKNKINPIANAKMLTINTPPAAMSFVFFMAISFSRVILLQRYSIAVLKASAAKTTPIHKSKMHHSMPEKLKNHANIIAKKAKNR
jgi:hypothetical protein